MGVQIKTQSDKLRANKNQHSQKNIESHVMDNNIMKVVGDIKNKLNETYDIEIHFQKKLQSRYVESLVSNEITTQECTFINPDGGFLYIIIDGKKHFILVSEQKRQGTNDKRLMEGKKMQSKGNAIERLGKNVKAFDTLFGNEDIYPFVVFIQGCDFFEEESTICDRVRTIASYQRINQINLNWVKLQKNQYFGGSYFMRGHSMNGKPYTSDWGYEEMYNVMYEIANRALNHYLQKHNLL
jgi:type II restriction enzyme